ncbi:hypothetical protein MKX07_005584 [Trichoderma sp. CBMAI-0711]|nr:hypothetical protein MKX07_005584 [Trichoderma sp. CBMAI-0711]
MSSSIPRSRSMRSATGIPSIPTRTSSSRDPSVPRSSSPTRLPSLKHSSRAVSTASSSSSSVTSLKNTAGTGTGGSTSTSNGNSTRAPPPTGGPMPGRLARAMTLATTKEVTARKEKSAMTNKYPPSTTVTRPSIQTRGRSASISMEGKPKELERRSTGLTYTRGSSTNLAGPTAVVKPASSTSRSRDPIRRPATPTAQPGIPTTTRRAVTPTALPRSNTFAGPVTPPSTKENTPPSARIRSPSAGPSIRLSRAATFAFSGRSRNTTRSVTPTTNLSTNSAASSRAVTPTGLPKLLDRRAPSSEKMASRKPSAEKVTVRKPSTEKVTSSRKPSLATLSRVVSRLSKPSSAGTLLSSDQAAQLKRPSNSSLQRPNSPGKTLSAKPSSSHLTPNSPSKLPANIAASAEVSKLQAELLQLYLLHQEAPIVDAEWRASAKEKLGNRFDRLSEESREVAELESAGLEKRNVLALRRWGSGGRLDEKIQSLESIITNVWSLSDPGGRYARVIQHFEMWIDGVSEMEDARSKGAVLVQGDDSLFIEDLDAQWKEEREDLIRLLEEWKLQLGEIDDLSRDEYFTEPPDDDEKSSLEKMLDGSRALIDDMLAELRIMEVIEHEALVREDDWIEKMNASDDDIRLSRVGGAWNEM